MQVHLDSTQSAELEQRASDVDDMLSILVAERRSATRESAFLAWSEHSESSAASWLIADRRDEIVAAHDQLVLAELLRRAERVVTMHGAEEIHAFVKDYVGQVSTDPEDPDILVLTGIMPHGEDDVPLGIMRRHRSEDFGLVDALADRFDLELPRDFELSCGRSNLMTTLKVAIEDEDGFAC